MAIINANTKLADEAIKNAVNLQRFSEGQRLKITKMLKRAQREIIQEIAAIDPARPKITKWKQARLKKLNDSIRNILDDTYTNIQKSSATDLKGLSILSAKSAINQINDALTIDLGKVTLTNNQLGALANGSLIEGRLMKDWWKKAKDDTRARLEGGMRSAVQAFQKGTIKGDTIGELVRRVRGTATQPGIWNTSLKEATTLIHTSSMQVANDARQEMYKTNENILEGFEVLATLDISTTPLCRSLDGRKYDFNFDPIPPNSVSLPPGGTPPYHFRCRTILMPLTKTYEQLLDSPLSQDQKKILNNTPDKARAAMGGPVKGNTTYNAWLKTQPKDVQIDVLGVKRREIWLKNNLSQSDLVHQNGRPLTLLQLEKKVTEGFRKIPEPEEVVSPVIEPAPQPVDKKGIEKVREKKAEWLAIGEQSAAATTYEEAKAIHKKTELFAKEFRAVASGLGGPSPAQPLYKLKSLSKRSSGDRKELAAILYEAKMVERKAFNKMVELMPQKEYDLLHASLSKSLIEYKDVNWNYINAVATKKVIQESAEAAVVEGMKIYPLDVMRDFKDIKLKIRIKNFANETDSFNPGRRNPFIELHPRKNIKGLFNSGTATHEAGHAFDYLASGSRKNAGLAWSDDAILSRKESKKLRALFNKQHNGKIISDKLQTYRFDAFEGEWVWKYDGRAYHKGKQGIGEEFFANGLERWQVYQREIKRYLDQGETLATAKRWARAMDNLNIGSWSKMERLYPELSKWIEANFNSRSMGGYE